ncbi:MAG: hypothetical protein WA130_16855 [Candidatus Methanoperedens sp.]
MNTNSIMVTMNKYLPIIFIILIAIALSGCTGEGTTKGTSIEVQKFDRANPNLDAKIVDVKFDRNDIRAGETVTAELFIANTGSEKITNETIEIKAKLKTLDDSLANLYLKTMSEEKKTRVIDPIEFGTEIEPGTVKSISAKFHTIKEMEGRNLAGTYEITITLIVNGQKIEARVNPITLYPGDVREFTPTPTPSPSSTPAPTPTHTPAPEIIETQTPTPASTPVPVVVATPTGKNFTTFVKDDKYFPNNLNIEPGDMVIWVNKMDFDYTLVEMDKKIPDMVLRARNNYIFNTTGEYRIALRYRNMHVDPKIQTINVRVNATK